MNKNKKKADQLGMSHGTAGNRLRKTILFDFAKRLDEDFCYRCGTKIESVEDFSVEHKMPWLDSEDPVGLFFDLDNIAFSHLSCNASAARHHTIARKKGTIRMGFDRRKQVSEGNSWCSTCQQELPIGEFHKNGTNHHLGVSHTCRGCRSKKRKTKEWT